MENDEINSEAETNSKWPLIEGRYEIGNPRSPVAVCTMASVDMKLPMENIAIAGKCVTENLGIEKIIRNVISNPCIRYILLCGRISNGHYVGQAIKSLIENGVNEEKRIIGAKGAMAILKNLRPEEIERFRRQVQPVDMEGEMDAEKILARIQGLVEGEPEPFAEGAMVIKEDVETIDAGADDGIAMDHMGYFLIRIDREQKEIVAEHYSNDSRMLRRIKGKSATDIYKRIACMYLVSSHDHAAYLGAELTKAEIALKNNLQYEQDGKLDLSKKEIKGGGD